MIIVTVFLAAILVGLTFIIHFIVLKALAARINEQAKPFRRPLLVVLITVFLLHVVEVFLYAVAFYGMEFSGLGHLAGATEPDVLSFNDFFYFSIVCYTTLGIGDIVPIGAIRLISGVEALNGLVLIAWSASFTYLMMERLWTEGPGSDPS